MVDYSETLVIWINGVNYFLLKFFFLSVEWFHCTK